MHTLGTKPAHYVLKQCRAIDGDSIEARVCLGFNVEVTVRLRLRGFYAPEPRAPSLDAGILATSLLAAYLSAGRITIESRGLRLDSYGRWLCWLWRDGRPASASDILGPLALTPAQHADGLRAARAASRTGPKPVSSLLT